jgi:hypothetical protein
LNLNANFKSHQKRALTFMLKREEGWQYDGSLDDMWAKEIDETGQMTLGEPLNLWHIYLHLQIYEHGYGNGPKDSAPRLERGSAG